MPNHPINQFFKHEAAGGIFLFAGLLLALICSNSDLASSYQQFWQRSLGVSFGNYDFTEPVLFWVNEGLMTLFFFLVGLELKREFLEGHLSGLDRMVLPVVAAVGGMVVPALLYSLANWNHPVGLQGWSVPVATDIALALGVLSLFGKKVPAELRLFLLTLAIFDDLGAILIIAVFNTASLSYVSMLGAAVCLLILAAFSWLHIKRSSLYLLVGLILWIFVLKTGVDATLTGVLLSMMIPNTTRKSNISMLKRMEVFFRPWVNFGVLPIFAFANAGISLDGMTDALLWSPVALGIVIGLFFGKQVGVMGVVLLFKHFRWCKFPEKTNWMAFYGVAILCGIGFTMSLFLGTLAFEGSGTKLIIEARLGVLMGSFLSGIVGATILWIAFTNKFSALRG